MFGNMRCAHYISHNFASYDIFKHKAVILLDDFFHAHRTPNQPIHVALHIKTWYENTINSILKMWVHNPHATLTPHQHIMLDDLTWSTCAWCNRIWKKTCTIKAIKALKYPATKHKPNCCTSYPSSVKWVKATTKLEEKRPILGRNSHASDTYHLTLITCGCLPVPGEVSFHPSDTRSRVSELVCRWWHSRTSKVETRSIDRNNVTLL
jgi:hypothetical protein